MGDIKQKIKGYLCVSVKGQSPERFVNLCSKQNIYLWNMCKKDDGVVICIEAGDFLKLLPIVHKAGTKVAILGKYGLPFFLRKIRKKYVFLLGVMLSLIFWTLSTKMIWNITIEGNLAISTEQIMSFLADENIWEGKLKKNINIENLEKELRNHFTDIVWTSGRFRGAELVVTIKENDGRRTPENEGSSQGDLIANKAGIVKSIITRKGISKVKEGQSVEPGMVLVEGKIPVYNDDGTVKEYLEENASADVMLQYEKKYYDSLPKVVTEKELTGRKSYELHIKIGDRRFTLPIGKKFDKYVATEENIMKEDFRDMKFPVSIFLEKKLEYLSLEHENSFEYCTEYFTENFRRFIQSLEEKGVQIIEKNVKIKETAFLWYVDGELILTENVGQY